MATVGTINVGIRADTRKFDKGMRDARKRMRDLDKTAKTVRRTMLAFGGALAGAAGLTFGVRAMTSALGDAASRLDSLAKTSAKLGIASEQLAGLQHAANQTGVSTELLNTSIEKMVVRTSEAAQGTGTAKDALKELGLSATELNRMKPDEQFVKIAQAMKGVENQADKTRLAYDIFGRSGVGLLNTLNLGASGLARFNEEAERLGLAIKKEDLAKVERLNDAMDTFRKAMQGTSNQLIITMAPAAAEALDGFTLAWTQFNKNAAEKGSTEAFLKEGVGTAAKFSGLGIINKIGQEIATPIFSKLQNDRRRDMNRETDIAVRLLRSQAAQSGQGGFGRSGWNPLSFQDNMQGMTGLGRMGGNLMTRGIMGGSSGLGEGADILKRASMKFDKFVDKHAKQADDMLKRRADSAAQLNAIFASPETILSGELGKISEALSFGLIGADVARRAGQSAVDAFGMSQPGTTAGNQNRLASLAEVGTIEGFRAMRQRGSDDPQKKQVDLAGKQLEQLKKLNEQIGNMGGGVVVLGEGVG